MPALTHGRVAMDLILILLIKMVKRIQKKELNQ